MPDAISTARESLSIWVGLTMGLYVCLLLGISFLASRRIQSAEDFVVAGRRLGLPLATATLVATWFGAGTLMAAADEIRASGLEAAALDPLGAGLCLLIFGMFFAKRLWEERLLTLPEIFGRRFGRRARELGAFLMIPPYLGWVAAQYMALTSILTLFFDIDPTTTMVGVACLGIAYTMLGGMWAVTLTDALQLGIVVVGLGALTIEVLAYAGGITKLWQTLPESHRIIIPMDTLPAFMGWLGVVAAGSLGNIPSQDVAQRVFSSRDAVTAKRACLLSGSLYLIMGISPVILGLVGSLMENTIETGTVTQLAAISLHPVMAVILSVTLMSVILSTIDGALLAPATVLVHDLWPGSPTPGQQNLKRYRVGVVTIGLVSLGLALAGENAYALLEASYELGMVSLLAPLVYALYAKTRHSVAAIGSMMVGTLFWALHYAMSLDSFLGIEGIPTGIPSMCLSFLFYPLICKLWREPGPQ